jgi:hypothetical protein
MLESYKKLNHHRNYSPTTEISNCLSNSRQLRIAVLMPACEHCKEFQLLPTQRRNRVADNHFCSSAEDMSGSHLTSRVAA